MTLEKLYKIVNEAPKFGKMTVIQDKDGCYCIFSTPDHYGELRRSKSEEDLEKAKEDIGILSGFRKDEFLEIAEEDNWQFHSYIDISEFFDRSGFQENMKVRNIETREVSKIMCLDSEKVTVDNESLECFWPYEFIEPVHEEEEDEEIKVGDFVKYIPTGNIFEVENIWADSCFGKFKLTGGEFMEARAMMKFKGDSGHYPCGGDIKKVKNTR